MWAFPTRPDGPSSLTHHSLGLLVHCYRSFPSSLNSSKLVSILSARARVFHFFFFTATTSACY